MSDNLCDAFCAAFTAVSGKPHVVDTEAEAAALIGDIVREAGANRVAFALLPDSLQSAAVAAVSATGAETLAPPYPTAEAVALIDKTDIGITGAAFGIAQTGTLVEVVQDDTHRLVSALPRTYIGILYADQLVDTLMDSAKRLRPIFEEGHPNIAISFISGPSRTGDIEMILTLGVHGPETAYAILIKEPSHG